MGKIDQILRVNYIVQILRQRKDGASYKEIENFLGEKFSDWDFNFSPRTFIRDKQSIKKIAGIEIAYSRSKKTYYISHEELEGIQENIFDTLLLIEAYR